MFFLKKKKSLYHTQEAEAKVLRMQDQPELHSEFRSGPGYIIRSYFKIG